jgi:hypothetical protein
MESVLSYLTPDCVMQAATHFCIVVNMRFTITLWNTRMILPLWREM